PARLRARPLLRHWGVSGGVQGAGAAGAALSAASSAISANTPLSGKMPARCAGCLGLSVQRSDDDLHWPGLAVEDLLRGGEPAAVALQDGGYGGEHFALAGGHAPGALQDELGLVVEGGGRRRRCIWHRRLRGGLPGLAHIMLL